MDSIEPLLAYHRAFCEASGTLDPNDLRFHKQYSRYYYELHHEGFSVEEMVRVVKFVMAWNKKAEAQYRRRIDPPHILGDLVRFCSDLSEANRLAALRTTPRQQALREFRRHDAHEDVKITARPVLDVLRAVIKEQ